MAQNQANFGLNFKVDKSGLNDLKKSLQDIMKLGQQKSATGEMTKELEQACKAAKQLEGILDGAWNSKLGQLNLDKVNQGIQTTFKSVGQLKNALDASGGVGTSAYNKMASQILSTNLQLKQTNKLLDDMAVSMANTVKWGITSSIFNNMTRSVQDAFYYVKSLDSSLNDIRIVTGASADQMASFAEKANAAAKALGQTTRNYTDASLIYYQQGLSEADVEARTQTTLKAANVTGQSTEEVSELLTSVWNGYKVSAAEAEMYIDKIAAVATTTASDLEELSIGMSKVASAASLMGVDIDQLNAQLATIVSVTRQAPESVGTALKTIYARMGDIEAGLDGETTLGNYTEQMKEMGFNVLDAQGKLRDMGSVIEEIGGKWSSMTREQQLSLAQTVAGTRQYNNLLALFDNWDMYTNALNTSNQAMGTLQEQQDIYMQTTEAHLKQLKAEAEETYSALLKAENINVIVDAFAGALDQLNDFIDGLGGGTNALVNFGSVAVRVFDKQIANSILRMQQNLEVAKINKAADDMKTKILVEETKKQNQMSNSGIDAESAGFNAQVEAAKKVHAVRNSLTQEQYKETLEIQKQIALETNKLETLKQQQTAAQDFTEEAKTYKNVLELTDDEIQDQINREKEKNKELENSIKALLEIKNLMLDIEQLQNSEDSDSNRAKAEIERKKAELSNRVIELEDELRDGFANTDYENAYDDLLDKTDKKTFDVDDFTEINEAIKQSRAYQEEHNKVIETGTQILNKRHTNLKDEIDLTEKNISNLKEQNSQYVKIGEKVSKIIKNVQTWATVGQILTAVGGGLSVIFDEASTGADKANAGFQMLISTASAFGPYGMLAAGILTVAKAGLEAVGWWEKIEDLCKSTSEKLAEIDEATSKNNALTQQTNEQVNSIREVEEEYEKLINKTDEYGFNLDRMTEEEKARYHELTNTFAQYNDAIILGYDEQGNAIVNNQNAIKDTIKLLKDEAEQRARNNLGNISEKLQTKNKSISDATEEVDTATAYKESLTQNHLQGLSNVANQFHNEIWALKDEVLDTQVTIEGTTMSVQELAGQLVKMTAVGEEPLDQDSFDYIVKGMNILKDTLKESDFKPETIFGVETESQADVFKNYQDTTLKSLQDFITSYEQAVNQATVNLENANKNLIEAQKLDANYLLSVVQYGEGYDQQWDALSEDAQQVGSRLVIDYVENLEYGMVKTQADKDKTGVYETAVSMVQNFISSFGEAFELSNSLLQEELDKANLDEFEGTATEYKEKIAEIIAKVLGQLDLSNFQNDEGLATALESYFKNAFNLTDLDIDFSEGTVDKIVSSAEEAYDQARDKVAKRLSIAGLYPKNGAVMNDWFEGILDESQLDNIDAILAKFDYAGYEESGQTLETLAIYLKKAAAAAEEAENSTKKYSNAIENNKNIIEKFGNKERLNAEEQEYLKNLEAEYPILRKLQRGTVEYSKALEDVQKQQSKKYKTELEEELENLKTNLKEKKEDLKNAKSEEDKISIQDEIDTDEARIQDIEYELNVIVVAEPSIKDQIKNLYDESDTLLTIRATLEKEEGLSDNQTTALGDFFASAEGQKYLSEYLDTGVLTDEMLTAVEAFAEGKRTLAEQSRESLRAEAEELTAAADALMKEAEEAFNEGHLKEAASKAEEANGLYAQAASTAAEEAQYNSEDAEREQQSFETEMDGFGLEADEVEDLAESIQDMAEESEELADSLEDDEDAAKELAKELKRYDKALESVSKNNKKWQKALESDNIEEQAEAIGEMDKAYSDLLDLDYGVLSNEFLTNAENLALMQEAANGSEEAYNQLQSLAQQDIIAQCKFNIDDFNEKSAEVQNKMAEMNFEDIEVGASLDDTDFLNALTEMVNASNMTAAQATAYLASMGIDAEVVEDTTTKRDTSSFVGAIANPTVEPVPGTDPLTGEDKVFNVPSITYDPAPMQAEGEKEQTSFALKVKSANKSSGGGFKHTNSKGGGGGSGGGGGKGKGGGSGKGPKKVGPRKKNYYHNVNNRLTKLGTQYDKLAEQQEKAFGKKHIDNLKKINTNLDKQIDKMRERIKIAKEQETKDLKDDIKKNFKEVKFNKDGTIKNYEEVLQKYYNKYKNAKTQEGQDKAKEKYDKLKEVLDEYETVILETIPGWESEMREKIDERYENLVHQFEYEIELRVNWGDSKREFEEFIHEVSDYGEDYLAKSDLQKKIGESFFGSKGTEKGMSFVPGEITSKTRQLNDALGELKKINDAQAAGKDITKEGDEKYFSTVWGDNKKGLMDYIATLQTDLMDNIRSIADAREEAYNNYLDALDESIERMDKHLEQYSQLTDELDHNRNLIELIYGEESDKMGEIYSAQHQVNIESLRAHNIALKNYKEQAEVKRKQLEEEKANNVNTESGLVTSDRYKELEKELEVYEDAIEETEATIKDLTLNSIENIVAEYEYIVRKTFRDLNAKNLGMTLSEAQTQWDLLNKEAEQYLDMTNRTFETQKLEAKFIDALNKTDNLKSQEKIRDVMDEQLQILEGEDKVSQYQVDRANLIYDLTLKQIALEEAQQNKSKMRLRRDAQGNYSYQFSADANLIKQTQQELLDVQQQLYNLDKGEYKNQLDIMAGYYQEWQEKLEEIAMIKDENERNRAAAMVNDYYERLIQSAAKQSQTAEENLESLINGPLSDFCTENEAIAKEITDMYNSAFNTMADTFVGEENGIAKQIEDAWNNKIIPAANAYNEKLSEISEASGKSFENLEDVSGIVANIGSITTATEALALAWKTTLTSLETFVTTLDAFLKRPEVTKAIEALGKSEEVEQTELNNAGNEAMQANIDLITPQLPDPPKPIKEDPEPDPPKPTKTTEPQKKKIKVGGKVNAKGAKIYGYAGGTGQKQYFSNDPKYKVLKISGNWIQVRYHKLSSGVTGWFKKGDVKALRTGGYTGDWNGDGGRLALLHKKELVLNQKDTQNILDAVNIIRGLSGLLQNSMINRIEGLTQSLNGLSLPTVQTNSETGPQSIEQTVHITAEFPGATEVIQIEQALENLVSRASQYALRRKE